MSLTGRAFFWVVLALTGTAFAATIVLQPRLAARGVRPVLGRISSLLVVNVLVVVSALVGANDHYAFFADWTDLRGALLGSRSPVSGYSAGAVATPATTAARPDPSRVRLFAVAGDGLRGQVMVTLPRGYESPDNRLRRYPVLETLHGYPGTPEQWNHSMAIRARLDTAAAHHQIADVITVSPTWEFPAGVDTECVDGGPRKPAVERWLTQVVPTWAEHALRVLPSPQSWATIGLSAGGWCAAMATMLHPHRYVAAIVLGGYFAPEFGHSYAPLRPVQALRYDLVRLASRRPPPVDLWVETSRADPLSYPSTAALLHAARAPTSVRALVLRHAGHRLGVWAAELPAALAWLGRLPGFAAS